MDAAKIIRQIMIERDMTITQLSELLEIKPQSTRNKLNRNSFTLSEFEKILEILNAELEVKTLDTGKIYK